MNISAHVIYKNCLMFVKKSNYICDNKQRWALKNGGKLLEQESHACPIFKNWESMAHIPDWDAQAPHRSVSGTNTSNADTSEEVVNDRRGVSFPFRSEVLR